MRLPAKRFFLQSFGDRAIELAVAFVIFAIAAVAAWVWTTPILQIFATGIGSVFFVYVLIFPIRLWQGAMDVQEYKESQEELSKVDLTGKILWVSDLRKTYKLGRVPVPVLHGVELSVKRGECVAILGASGSGKSTLLHLCGGLDRPDRARQGQPRPSIVFDGNDMAKAGKRELDRYRSHDVGFVFQFYHLLPELTVLENVTIGAMIRHGRLGYMGKRGESVRRATQLLESFGLGHRLKHRSSQLSGGERQRVAIARALINDPELLLADEPTGNLDRNTGGAILDAIFEHRARTGLTVLMVTHDEAIAERADRVVRLVDGRVVHARGSLDRASGVQAPPADASGTPGR